MDIRRKYHLKKFNFNEEEFDFLGLFSQLFGVTDLEHIHEFMGRFDVFNRAKDQNTILHKVFYSNFKSRNSSLAVLYERFIRNFISSIVPESFYFQKIPTLRVGLPKNKFVGEFHKDTLYNHLPYELNFNLPIVNYKNSAALLTEDFPGSGNLISVEIDYGQVMSFDHIDCIHGSNINETEKTMISLDFRLALKDFYYEDLAAKSVNTKSYFIIGDYFSDEHIN